MKSESWADELWDLVVWGGGYAGWGAALAGRAAQQKVLWVDSSGVLLPETSWSFSPREGICDDPLYQSWENTIAHHAPGLRLGMEGTLGEICAHRTCQDQGIQLLFYVWLESACGNEEQISSLQVVSKAGRHRIRSRRWVDTSLEGELASLWSRADRSAPFERKSYAFFRRDSWGNGRILEGPVSVGKNETVSEVSAGWDNERVFCLAETPPENESHRVAWLRALPLIRKSLGTFSSGSVLSHLSFIPELKYRPVPLSPPVPTNLAIASPIFAPSPPETCAGRFKHGMTATRRLLAQPAPAPTTDKGHDYRKPHRQISCEVAVAGLGTAGSLAALAARRQGATVCACDSLPFPGGVGTAGGIHLYYFGVPGGLQNEVDQRIRQVQGDFGSQDQIGGFHPVAKAAVLESMLAEAGVQTFFSSFVSQAEFHSRSLKNIEILNSSSETKITAASWIDCTGDGDLCAMAGVTHQRASRKDGLPLAYTQSSGRFRYRNDRLFHRIVNYDSGFVDSLSPQDLTRARITGILQHEQTQYTTPERPTYLAPALGVRQGRHIQTVTTLKLQDLLEKRKFPDRIGLTGCHYDTHHTDTQFEDEEVVFWLWACRNWKERTASEIPYGMIVPRDLDNVWIACRAAGCTPDAHHSMRMQRDMQRLGEAAGVAASLAVQQQCGNRHVPIAQLQEILRRSGALQAEQPEESPFGYVQKNGTESIPTLSKVQLLAKLEAGYGPAMYQIYLKRDELLPDILERVSSRESALSWKCACILAMWSDARSVPRLLQAIDSREYGFSLSEDLEGKSPGKNSRFAPNWLVALVLLRRCPDLRALPVLQAMVGDPKLTLDARTSLLLTLAELARHPKTRDPIRSFLPLGVQTLLASDPPGRCSSPQRNPSGEPRAKPDTDGVWYPKVVEDFLWQLHWAGAWALHAAGLPSQPHAKSFLNDSRGPVRNAFSKILHT